MEVFKVDDDNTKQKEATTRNLPHRPTKMAAKQTAAPPNTEISLQTNNQPEVRGFGQMGMTLEWQEMEDSSHGRIFKSWGGVENDVEN